MRADVEVCDNAPSPAALASLIEGEIIPRLLMAHRDEPVSRFAAVEADVAVTDADVDTLASVVLRSEADALLRMCEDRLARGMSIKVLFVDLLAPVARRLGDYWDDDLCDFIDVTMGLWRLQEVVREISSRQPTPRRGGERSALFSGMPGEQHSFGAVMVEELFRGAGWTTASVADADRRELLDLVSGRAFDVVGLTLTCESNLDALPDLIATIRRVSRNPRIVVMVGGRVLNDDPELAMRVGADGTAPNGAQAIAKAQLLVDATLRQTAARA